MEVAAIMTNASVSILYTKNRQITRYNLGFAAMFGYSGDEALGLPGRALYVSQQSYDLLGAAAFPFLSVGQAVPDGSGDDAPRRQHPVGAADRLCRQSGRPGRRHHLDHRGPHGSQARRRIPAQRAAGKPGHPRQRRAGHLGGGGRLQPALPTARWKSCSAMARARSMACRCRPCIRTWPRGRRRAARRRAISTRAGCTCRNTSWCARTAAASGRACPAGRSTWRMRMAAPCGWSTT